ncbi:MAG TPA: hypothetical protein VL123_02020 [Candidatus Udaeobacter sp.]|jgi:hypothetical protein|nr:hypothetical protein [Candidatus Udaeobacter sp.]
MRRRIVFAGLVALTLTVAAAQADPAAPGADRAAAPAHASKSAVSKAPASKARRSPRSRAGTSASGIKPPAADSTQRRLTDIHIEGEIPVPQVLFVTASDQRRFIDLQHRRYLRSAAELGKATGLPARIQSGGAPVPRADAAESPSTSGGPSQP